MLYILVYGHEPAARACEMVNELPCSFGTAGIYGPNVHVTSILLRLVPNEMQKLTTTKLIELISL